MNCANVWKHIPSGSPSTVNDDAQRPHCQKADTELAMIILEYREAESEFGKDL